MIDRLKFITEALLQPNIGWNELKEISQQYKSLLLSFSSVNLTADSNKSDLKLENGVAIGMTWAASCLDDVKRTREFILGTQKAIEEKLKKNDSVHLLYAGTGPFATLVLPLIAHYPREKLRVTLLDVNSDSIDNVRQIVRCLGLEESVRAFVCGDAAKIELDDSNSIDIVLSETMQHALQRELQVLITINLLKQLRAEVVLIPQSIDLSLIGLNEGSECQDYTSLGNIFSLDLHSRKWDTSKRILQSRLFDLSDNFSESHQFLAIGTRIQIFENQVLNYFESGLTVPKIIASTVNLKKGTKVRLNYVLNPEPDFELKFC